MVFSIFGNLIQTHRSQLLRQLPIVRAEKEKENQACHEPEGVFYTYGAGIRRGVQVNALRVYDLVPTILHAFNIPVKEPFDGRVAREIFIEDTTREVDAKDSMIERKLKLLQAS